ncbi:MAG: hypothetical protein Q4Q24_00415 [Methanobrevibacter ruminantium]|uniref:hypothetical protein n=1 Tax=Methanobrevibacter ruminantium TaxID=83816 RepID=UPI0026EB6D6B|nr:hypothetical protein [Methanobrevibacter ruminantium]MDO5841717.1 hypothetical protein [Methanobrevibacter ruminantium]
MISLHIFKIDGLKENHLEYIQDYTALNEKEEEFNVELKQYISNFNKSEKNLIDFKFTHESVTKIQIDERNFPNFHVDSAEIWISFKHPQTYIFINSSSNLEFIISELKRIIQINLPLEQMVELEINEIDLRNYFAEVIKKDASEVLSGWWKGLNANDHSINLHGILRDDEGIESEMYTLINETAKTKTSVRIMSKKLVNTITISKNKLYSPHKEVNSLTLIEYFDKIIFPLFKSQQEK